MPRVVCPECDQIMKVSESEVRTSVRCTNCTHLVHLLSATHADAKSRSRRHKEGPYTKYLVWIPTFAVLSLGTLLLLAGIFSPTAASGAIAVGILALAGGFIWGVFLLNEDKAYIGFDYLGLLGSSRLIIMFLLCGLVPLIMLYLLGYVLFILFTQMQYSFSKPRRYRPAAVLDLLGIVFLIAGVVVTFAGEINRERREMARFEVERQKRLEDDKQQRLKNPPPKQQPIEEKKDPPKNEKLPKEKEKEKENVAPRKELPVAAKLTGDAGLDRLLNVLEFGEPPDNQVAANQLAQTPPDEHQAIVGRKLADLARTNELKWIVIPALGVWATPDEFPVMILLFEENDLTTQGKMVKILGRHKDARIAATLVRHLEKGAFHVEAKSALKEMGPVAEKEVQALLKSKNGDLKIDGINLLGDIGTPDSVPALEALVKSDAPRFQTIARQALQLIAARSKKK